MASLLRIWFTDDFGKKYSAFMTDLAPKAQSEPEEAVSTHKFPHRLPSGTKWVDFILKFLTKEKVLVQVRGISEEMDYIKMGFEDRRSKRPDSQWAFLLLLSKNAGEISWDTQEADDKFKKVKERLNVKLQEYFRIDYDTFHPYSEEEAYKIKLTLVPPPTEVVSKSTDVSSEVADIFNELTQE